MDYMEWNMKIQGSLFCDPPVCVAGYCPSVGAPLTQLLVIMVSPKTGHCSTIYSGAVVGTAGPMTSKTSHRCGEQVHSPDNFSLSESE